MTPNRSTSSACERRSRTPATSRPPHRRAPAELTAEQVAPALEDNLVRLDFYQASCPPCRALEPRLEAFARRHRDHVRVYRVDLDHNDKTPGQFHVMSLPTLVLLRDGREIARLDGLIRDDDLEALLEGAAASE